ncbi:hypothetical protein ABTY96_37325 [Streptomyces sp. NPDC096057]
MADSSRGHVAIGTHIWGSRLFLPRAITHPGRTDPRRGSSWAR